MQSKCVCIKKVGLLSLTVKISSSSRQIILSQLRNNQVSIA